MHKKKEMSMKSNKNKYFDIVSNKDDIDLKIKWNVKFFITNDKDTGYIVQHMIIASNVSSVKNDDYWECWHVKNRKLENRTNKFDDNWSPIPHFLVLMGEDEINASPDGLVKYSAKVYWIPDSAEEYNVISQWKPILGGAAGELPMTHDFDYDVSRFFKCNRFYEWNYKEELKKIKNNELVKIKED